MQRRRMNSKVGPRRDGFTLIELLVCIAVIGLLAAMLVPALARAKAKGVAMACLNNVRQISLATLMYADDFRDRLPYNLGQEDIARAAEKHWYYNWTSPVMSWELDSDNTNTTLLTRGGIGPYTSKNARIYRCPSDSALSNVQLAAGWSGRVRSISMNAMTGDAGEYTVGGTNVNNPGYRQFFKLSQIPRPTSIFLFIDEHPDSINDGYFLNTDNSGKWIDLPASFHGGGANLSFADGHAEKHAWSFSSTKPSPRPEAAGLPFQIPESEQGDFEWLMERTSLDEY
jgi:prepilin-type N-terminal cleavage/methylation domain-containing protein/prepilin-type processing-associated H-X9-DG protein